MEGLTLLREIADLSYSYSMYVGASQMDRFFEFKVAPRFARVLIDDKKKHAIFRNVLYFLIQERAFGPNAAALDTFQQLFDDVAEKILISDPESTNIFLASLGQLTEKIKTQAEKDYAKLLTGATYTEWGL